MKFITILICLSLLRWTKVGKDVRHYIVYEKYIEIFITITKKIKSKLYGWGIILLLLPSVAYLISFLLSKPLFGLLNFVFGVLVLFYSLGSYRLNEEEKEITFDSMVEMFFKVNQNLFSVLFWFVLLGPCGAILYRLNVLLTTTQHQEKIGKLSIKLEALLDWIPIRLFTLSAALMSHFVSVIMVWVKTVFGTNERMLRECGLAALRDSKEESLNLIGSISQKILALVDRVLIVWLIFIALTVIML